MFKLCKLLIKCCKKDKKDVETKKETEAEEQDKIEEDDDRKGPEVDIFKDGDILKDGSPRTQSSHSAKLLTGQTDIKQKSKENVAGTKRSHSGTSSLVIKQSKHGSGDKIAVSGGRKGSKDNMAAPESRRGSKETAAEPSTSRRTSKGNVQVRRSSHSHKTVAVEKPKSSPPQVGNVFYETHDISYLLLYIYLCVCLRI